MSKQQHSALYDQVKETYFSRLRTEEANVLISRITSLYLNMMETEREKDGAAIFGQITSMNSFPYYEYVDAMGEDGFERFVSYLLTITQDQLDELLAECWRGNEASSTPAGIVELVNALYPMSSDASVLDLCAGQANFLWNRHELYPGNELFGLEIDPSILEITRRYFSTKGIPCRFRLGDALNENPFLLDNKTFDLVFTNFPFGLRGTEGLFADEQRYKLNFYSNPKDSSWQFIKAALNLMATSSVKQRKVPEETCWNKVLWRR
jgi:type I restriction-modification system DNA methylase subunit